ncbi:hypothetical protein DSO57_1026636 [Entomophthora muscae]|uniref:Uncharacterized protein n=1 Tax=Entomophthora muscae TaxID=34485 RepID=A0ACC2TZV4_9FUNG|nr:hypothetical protein DSO57_1026636 [Entomophthora muscae]
MKALKHLVHSMPRRLAAVIRTRVHLVATEFPSSPANVSYDTQGVLNESPLDISNDMNQSDGNIELRAVSPN